MGKYQYSFVGSLDETTGFFWYVLKQLLLPEK